VSQPAQGRLADPRPDPARHRRHRLAAPRPARARRLASRLHRLLRATEADRRRGQPRYREIAGVSDRRSEELDQQLEAWEAEQRAQASPSSRRDLDAWEAELSAREDALRRRELEQRERELEERRRGLDDPQ
jgi:hypothetical protein